MPTEIAADLRLEEAGLLSATPHGEEVRWFEAAARGELVVSSCPTCGHRTFPLRVVCAACGQQPMEDLVVSGAGTIYSFTVQQRRQHPDVPIPNVIALVELAEGPRLMTRIVTDDPDAVSIGAAVQARFVEVGELAVPVFVLDERGT